MKHKCLSLVILLILSVFPLVIADVLESDKITPLADTYVDAFSVNSTYGDRDYLEVSEHVSGLCIIFLMFDLSEISHVFDPSLKVKLRLYCFDVASPHVVGVHWCINNSWSEENLTFRLLGKFFKTDSEDAVLVDSTGFWYEWTVTNLVSTAMEQNYERITLTLEVEDPLEGMARSLYASKDQEIQEMREYSPQLVLPYPEPPEPPILSLYQILLYLVLFLISPQTILLMLMKLLGF